MSAKGGVQVKGLAGRAQFVSGKQKNAARLRKLRAASFQAPTTPSAATANMPGNVTYAGINLLPIVILRFAMSSQARFSPLRPTSALLRDIREFPLLWATVVNILFALCSYRYVLPNGLFALC